MAYRSRRHLADEESETPPDAGASGSEPPLRIETHQLMGLIGDIRATLARGVADVPSYLAALARLEVEAARRMVELPGIEEQPAAALPAPAIDRDALRATLSVAATSQALQDFADVLSYADLQLLWFAFKQTRTFEDEDERTLALNHVAYFLTQQMTVDMERAAELELLRTERLSEASHPRAWLEQELLRMFGQLLRVGEDPTKK